MFRLQNLIGDKPLVLGELGLDTIRHGEWEQAKLLAGHLGETMLLGLAGVFVFSWTDDWHTGGQPITTGPSASPIANRTPKLTYYSLQKVFKSSAVELLDGQAAGVGCRLHLQRRPNPRSVPAIAAALDYPNFEVIVVDDGSTDDTKTILADIPPSVPSTRRISA